jgi:hypothetical protein
MLPSTSASTYLPGSIRRFSNHPAPVRPAQIPFQVASSQKVQQLRTVLPHENLITPLASATTSARGRLSIKKLRADLARFRATSLSAEIPRGNPIHNEHQTTEVPIRTECPPQTTPTQKRSNSCATSNKNHVRGGGKRRGTSRGSVGMSQHLV